MSVSPVYEEPGRIDEPRGVQEYSDVLTQVAVDHRPVIVRRNGADLAAVIPLEHLELLREAVARQQVEARAAELDLDRTGAALRPPQTWFDDEDNPFQAEEESAP